MLVRKAFLIRSALLIIFATPLSFIIETDAMNHGKPVHSRLLQINESNSLRRERRDGARYFRNHKPNSITNLTQKNSYNLSVNMFHRSDHIIISRNSTSHTNDLRQNTQLQRSIDSMESESSYFSTHEEAVSPSDRREHPAMRKGAIPSIITDNSIRKEKTDCITCTTERESSSLSSSTLRDIRLEFIKKQILRKLRMDEPPTTTFTETFPESIQQALHSYSVPSHTEDEEYFIDDDSSLGKIEQIIAFPEHVSTTNFTRSNASIYLTFNVPKEIHVETVGNAELWIYFPYDDLGTEVFSVVDLSDRAFIARNIQEMELGTSSEERWIKLNITDVIMKWRIPNFSIALSTLESRTIQLICQTCNSHDFPIPDMSTTSKRPFLIITMADIIQKRRKRRNLNCSPGMSRCCRDRLEVDFSEVFETNFIISPKKYEAFFCKGSCFDVLGYVPNPDKHHITFRQKIVQKRGLSNQTAALVPCCAATKMTGITLLYKQNNDTIKRETLPNMVVESCGCH